MSTSVLQSASDLIQGRLSDLNEEKSRLEKALEALSPVKVTRGRPKAKRVNARGRRSRKGGTRLEQATALINQKPGITAAEIAKRMKIKPNYLYRVLGELVSDGAVTKDGRRYSPK